MKRSLQTVYLETTSYSWKLECIVQLSDWEKWNVFSSECLIRIMKQN